MEILLNGQGQELSPSMTVADLLDRLNFQPVRVAVEINEDLVPRKNYREVILQAGDRVEIVTFVGGG
ncbi:MAG: sulfur carrier protein ThiS [Planctomycetota bacterium]